MTLKSRIKSILPGRLTAAIGSIVVGRRERLLAQLPLEQAFDKIYKNGMWKQGDVLSGIGSEGILAKRYVQLVSNYAAKHKLRTVVDGGTGDFAVGSQLACGFERYIALDVSSHIIEINKRLYSDSRWRHVEFMAADLMKTHLPAADLVLIRQVLQHLTNAQIESVLRNLEACSWRRALITEDVHDPLKNEAPNLDLPSHSVRTRRSIGSGVFLDKPPFNRKVTRLATIFSSDDDREQSGGLLVFEFSRDA